MKGYSEPTTVFAVSEGRILGKITNVRLPVPTRWQRFKAWLRDDDERNIVKKGGKQPPTPPPPAQSSTVIPGPPPGSGLGRAGLEMPHEHPGISPMGIPTATAGQYLRELIPTESTPLLHVSNPGGERQFFHDAYMREPKS